MPWWDGSVSAPVYPIFSCVLLRFLFDAVEPLQKRFPHSHGILHVLRLYFISLLYEIPITSSFVVQFIDIVLFSNLNRLELLRRIWILLAFASYEGQRVPEPIFFAFIFRFVVRVDVEVLGRVAALWESSLWLLSGEAFGALQVLEVEWLRRSLLGRLALDIVSMGWWCGMIPEVCRRIQRYIVVLPAQVACPLLSLAVDSVCCILFSDVPQTFFNVLILVCHLNLFN